MGLLNLEEQLGFYRKYHCKWFFFFSFFYFSPISFNTTNQALDNTTNVLIHVVFVPTILFSTLLITSNVPLPFTSSASDTNQLHVFANLGFASSVAYGLFYALLDPKFGLPSLLILPSITYELSKSVWTPGSSTIFHCIKSLPILAAWSPTSLATLLFVVGWLVQFVGHGVFEQRAPALLDNLVQALVLAPFFVVFEIAHFLGFRKDVMDRVDKKVLPEIKQFHQAKKNKTK